MHLAFLTLLCCSGAETSTTDSDYHSALAAAVHRFAEEGELGHLRAILDRHPRLVDASQPFAAHGKPSRTDGFTALHFAAENGQEDAVAYLIRKGAKVNTYDGGGVTPLHLAAKEGHLAVVKQLVKAGADVNAKDDGAPEQVGPPPGASPEYDGPTYFPAVPGRTALEWAKARKHAEVVKYLSSVTK